MRKNLRINYLLCLLIVVLFQIFLSPLFAVEDDKSEKYPMLDTKKPEIPSKVKATAKGDIDVYANFVFGYDDNVRLEHYDKDGSIFFQESLDVKGRYFLNDIFTLRGAYSLTLINYAKFSDANLLDNLFDLGIDAKIADNLTWSFDYRPDVVGFPHDHKSKYTEQAFETALRHNITKKFYHKIMYNFFTRHYPKWATRNNYGNRILGDREDLRNTVNYQVGYYLFKNMFVRDENIFFYNDSNEKYMRYYDYASYMNKATVIHFTTKKLYEIVNFMYQYKHYNKRGVFDKQEDERDHLFGLSGSVFYDINKNVSLGVNINYRRNLSNEGDNKYRDFIISSGLYSKF